MIHTIDFIFDFETRSRLDLKKRGVVNYALDPSTEWTLLTYCFGRTGAIKYLKKGDPIPAELIHVAENPHLYRFVAWNILFDYMIWTNVLIRDIPTLKRPPLENIDDCMALSCNFRTGASLESAAKFLNLPYTKDKVGRVLMLKTCKPNSKGNFYEMNAHEWEDFIRYGMMDTRILRDVYYRMIPLPHPERYAFEWTFRRNLRGIKIDKALIDEMNSILLEVVPKLVEEFNTLTNFKAKINSPVTCKAFFKEYYPYIEDMQSGTVQKMLADTRPVPPQVRRALEIKDLAGSTSIAKVKTALDIAYNGRIYEVLAYGYAQTKRWAGRGIQIQNFPRVDDSRPDSLDFDMNVDDLTSYVRSVRPGLKDPVGFVKNLLRRIWLPSKGKMFYCGDFSKIEPTVLFWLCGLGPIPKKWYEEMAAEIYNLEVYQIGKESEERQVGKTAALSCGYGAGWESFKTKTQADTGIALSDDMAKQVIHSYRRKYHVVVQFWRDLETGFRKAIYGESSSLCNGKIHIMPMPSPWKGVQIRLPSGSYLYYHQAKETTETFMKEIVELVDGVPHKYKVPETRRVLSYLADHGGGNIGREFTYSGKLCENVVSAIARDVMVPAMWRLEQANFEVLGCVHDELWGEAEAGRDKEFTSIMCQRPSWCSDMVIEADLKYGVRYLK